MISKTTAALSVTAAGLLGVAAAAQIGEIGAKAAERIMPKNAADSAIRARAIGVFNNLKAPTFVIGSVLTVAAFAAHSNTRRERSA